jgi:ketosteroid isomerase-like protein
VVRLRERGRSPRSRRADIATRCCNFWATDGYVGAAASRGEPSSRTIVVRSRTKGEILHVMSRENVELLRTAFDNFLAGKSEFGAELLDPEIEWDASETPVLDISGVYRGAEAVRQFWREWLAAWETVQFEYELVDAGDRVVALIDQRMQGRSTGIEVLLGKYAQVYTFRDGLIVHWKLYMSQSEALEAASTASTS